MNRHDPSHELFEELAAGHALHALEPEDEHLFLLHAAGCARCERSLVVHSETAAHLAYGAGPAELPEGLFDRIRAAVVAESGEQVFGPAPALAPVVPLSSARRRRLPRTTSLVAAAAAVALVTGLAGSNVALRQDRVEQTASSGRLTEAVRTIEAGGRSVPLLDDRRQVAAVAVLQGDSVSLVVEGLAPNVDETTYVLWERTRFGGLRALGTFDVEDDVEVVRDLPLRSGKDDVAALAITREKGRTAPARPLVAPVASGAVEQA